MISRIASWYDSFSTLRVPVETKVESRENLSQILTRNPCSVEQMPIDSDRVKLANISSGPE